MYLIKEWDRATLTHYKYAIKDQFERQRLANPWNNKMFDNINSGHSFLMEKYRIEDGKPVSKNGASRMYESGVECLLQAAIRDETEVLEQTNPRAGSAEGKSFLNRMHVLTGIIFILRASSCRFSPEDINFLPNGNLILTITFFKRTKNNKDVATPVDKQLPPGDSTDHPRSIYIRLMRTVVQLGGFKQLPVKNPGGVLTKMFKTAMGDLLPMFFEKGRQPSSHSMRKTGASAIYKVLGSHVTTDLVDWGEWGSPLPVKRYVDKHYKISIFSRRLFDWFRG